jgi:hypothetical protein
MRRYQGKFTEMWSQMNWNSSARCCKDCQHYLPIDDERTEFYCALGCFPRKNQTCSAQVVHEVLCVLIVGAAKMRNSRSG